MRSFAVASVALASLAAAAPVNQASTPQQGALDKRYTGQATWFEQGGNAGSCGTVHQDSDYIAAISSDMSPDSHCGQKIKVTNTDSGKSIVVKAADTCPTCNEKSLDLSKGAFEALGSLDQGVLPISWDFTDDSSDYSKRNLAKRYTGKATFYYQGGNAGSCGQTNSDDSYIAALSSNVSPDSNCGRKIKVTNQDTGATVEVTAADTCPTCDDDSLDLSKAAFDAIGSEDQGVLPITWDFVD